MDTLSPRLHGTRMENRLMREEVAALYLDWKCGLALKEVVPSDTGTYSCNVSNLLGWINHSYYLDVYGKVLI